MFLYSIFEYLFVAICSIGTVKYEHKQTIIEGSLLHDQNRVDICQTVQFWKSAIYRSMNSLIGIDIGFGSHFVALATPSNDGATEPRIDVVLNEKKESENKLVYGC